MDFVNRQENEENQYIQLIKDIMEKGSIEKGRNGDTKSLFGYSMRFSLQNGRIPILTSKKMAWKTCFKELMWFLRGETDNKILKKHGVHIWDGNGSREFLDSRGLHNYEEDELGPVYGWQWRNFNKPYITNKEKEEISNEKSMEFLEKYDPLTHDSLKNKTNAKGIDQIQQLIDALRDPEQRTSRRLILTAWNPCQLEQMALPPCHILCQFNVREGKYLSCALYQRSGDVGLGVPFNIASYSFLTHIMAKHCGLIADEFVYFLGNAHIYMNHMNALKEQLTNQTFPFPEIEIKNTHEKIEDYTIEDIEWKTPYIFSSKVSMDMVA
jgi:thymidylate synthase